MYVAVAIYWVTGKVGGENFKQLCCLFRFGLKLPILFWLKMKSVPDDDGSIEMRWLYPRIRGTINFSRNCSGGSELGRLTISGAADFLGQLGQSGLFLSLSLFVCWHVKRHKSEEKNATNFFDYPPSVCCMQCVPNRCAVWCVLYCVVYTQHIQHIYSLILYIGICTQTRARAYVCARHV